MPPTVRSPRVVISTIGHRPTLWGELVCRLPHKQLVACRTLGHTSKRPSYNYHSPVAFKTRSKPLGSGEFFSAPTCWTDRQNDHSEKLTKFLIQSCVHQTSRSQIQKFSPTLTQIVRSARRLHRRHFVARTRSPRTVAKCVTMIGRVLCFNWLTQSLQTLSSRIALALHSAILGSVSETTTQSEVAARLFVTTPLLKTEVAARLFVMKQLN